MHYLVYIRYLFGDPQVLFLKIISLSIINYFDNFKKFCGAEKKIYE
jgi:hypothetical protein